jgi:bacteriorhodopsin
MAANVFILMNHVFGVAVMLPFANLMIPGFDSSGVLVENYYAGMYVFIDFFSAFFFINVMLNIYAIFLLMKLSIEEAKRNAELEERDSSWTG